MKNLFKTHSYKTSSERFASYAEMAWPEIGQSIHEIAARAAFVVQANWVRSQLGLEQWFSWSKEFAHQGYKDRLVETSYLSSATVYSDQTFLKRSEALQEIDLFTEAVTKECYDTAEKLMSIMNIIIEPSKRQGNICHWNGVWSHYTVKVSPVGDGQELELVQKVIEWFGGFITNQCEGQYKVKKALIKEDSGITSIEVIGSEWTCNTVMYLHCMLHVLMEKLALVPKIQGLVKVPFESIDSSEAKQLLENFEISMLYGNSHVATAEARARNGAMACGEWSPTKQGARSALFASMLKNYKYLIGFVPLKIGNPVQHFEHAASFWRQRPIK